MKSLLLFVAILLMHEFAISQNVGIGTTSPTQKLHVAGNIKADTIKPNALKLIQDAGQGKVLTSDGAGNGTWQNMQASGAVGYGGWGDCATNSSVSEFNPVGDTTAAVEDLFGYNVSISGDFAIIGTPLDDETFIDQGSASIYQFNGTTWIFKQKLIDPAAAAGDYFGYDVHISGDYAIVGVPLDNETLTDQGSAVIFHFNGTNWVWMQKITDATGASDDLFGASAYISGNYAIVGAFGDDGAFIEQGSASIYQNISNNWVLMQKLTSSTGAQFDNFGLDVIISGTTAMVGAPSDDTTFMDQGTVSIYHYNGSAWVLSQKIIDTTQTSSSSFGSRIAISGNYIIVGSPADQIGTNQNQGSATVFRYNGSSWKWIQRLTDAEGEAFDNLGTSVDISGNYAIVGASADNVENNPYRGSAIIFVKVGAGWQKMQKLTDPGGSTDDTFGFSSAISGPSKRFVVGVKSFSNGRGKAVFGKIN